MKVTIHADGIDVKYADDEQEQKNICDLVDMLTLDLDVFPQSGWMMSFAIGKYVLDAKVEFSYINYCEPGNEYKKERVWGVKYDVFLEYLEIVEVFDK